MTYYDEISECVLKGELEKVKEYVNKSLEESDQPRAIIDNGLLAGMAVVGRLFKAGDMFIPEVMRSAQTMANAMTILEPLIVGSGTGTVKAKVLMGTVKADLHNIGKDLVSMMLRSSGFEVKDIGVDVPKERFMSAVMEYKPDILAQSLRRRKTHTVGFVVGEHLQGQQSAVGRIEVVAALDALVRTDEHVGQTRMAR